ncbi:MAG: hypothetical protein ACR2KH_06105 [Sphingomicrobium sp.]
MVAEALLAVTATSNSVKIELGPQALALTNIGGAVDLPAQNGTLSNIIFAGGVPNLGTGAGDLQLPPVAGTLSNGSGDGTIAFDDLTVPGIPMPVIMPVAVDLTPSAPLELPANVVLGLDGPSAATRFGLLFRVREVEVGQIGGLDPNLENSVAAALQSAVNQIFAQLSIPAVIAEPAVVANIVTNLVAPIPKLVAAAFDDALTRLLGETGRLLYPGAGASCDADMMATGADAALNVTTSGTYLLQVGFKRAGSTALPGFPAFTPTGNIDCNVLIGNAFLLDLVCCLVERLPAFSLPIPATVGTVDVANNNHVRCCNLTSVTANFGGVAIGGGATDGISVCLDGEPGKPKQLSLVGHFTAAVKSGLPVVSSLIPLEITVANVRVDFTLPLGFDVDDAASVANLRVAKVPDVDADVSVGFGFGLLVVILIVVTAAIGGWIAGIVITVMAPVAAIIVMLLVYLAFAIGGYLLDKAARTLLSGASLLRSPVALPPGVFDAFGKFAPSLKVFDDLIANGVLHTPTSPWALLPRVGPAKRPPDKPVGRPPVRDPKAEVPRPPRPKPPGASPTARSPKRRPTTKRS